MSAKQNVEKRLAILETTMNKIKAEMDETLINAYQIACEEQDEVKAAELARNIRNNLLYKSDKEFTLDKMLPEMPTGNTFTSWLVWLKALASITTNEWAVYRKALRDLPQQSGFPFKVNFPKPPNYTETNNLESE